MHLLLTNFSFHATQKTKTQKKKILSPKLTKSFCVLFFADPLLRFAKGGFKGCGENPNSPRFLVLFRNRKRTSFFIQESILQNGQYLPHQAPKVYLLPPFLFELIFSFFQNLKNTNIFYVLKSLLPVSAH